MTTGFWWNILIYIAFGLVAELIASKGQYNKKRNLALAFCILQWGVVLASYFLIYLFRDSYIQIMLDLGLLSTLQEAQEHVAIFTSEALIIIIISNTEALIIIIISNIIGQVLGVYIGLKVNKKHFEKAGMI
jgi:energy-coupling factor transport system substrate-specific component